MDWNNINTDRDTSGLGPIEYDQSRVPNLIRKYADDVRTKTYGQEVREAQARNAEYAGLIASEANSKATIIEHKTHHRLAIVEISISISIIRIEFSDTLNSLELIS